MARRDFGSIQKIGENRYKVLWTDNGRRRSKTVRGSYRDASDYLARVQIGVDGADKTVTYDMYWDAVVRPSMAELAPKTISEYERLWTVELQPRIGRRRVSSTTYREAQRVILEISAPSVQKKSRMLWHKICNMAVFQDRLLDYNPIQGVKTMRVKPREKSIYERDEITRVLKTVRGYKVEPLVLLSLGCGLRPEECFALDWDDLSFDGGCCFARISKTVVLVNGRAVEQERTKTARSAREAACAGVFASRLQSLAEGKSGPLSPSCMGGRTSPATIAHNWKNSCARWGIKHVTFENMRTNYKTLASEAMIPAELVRIQMGHAGATVAETNYMVRTRRITRTVAEMYAEYIEGN